MNKAGRIFLMSIPLLIFASTGFGQRPSEVVKWTATTTKSDATMASVTLSATIEDGWHVYALSQPEGGPRPLKISMPADSPFALAKPVAETRVTKHFDPNFKMETLYYLKSVSFDVALKRTANAPTGALPIDVRFQACNNDICLPPYTTHLTALPARK